ncbi:MAG: hypothetical protein CW346_01575 [Bacillaceae bacterium]|nr:hypothetical protein [Bacillaceae bacterium]
MKLAGAEFRLAGGRIFLEGAWGIPPPWRFWRFCNEQLGNGHSRVLVRGRPALCGTGTGSGEGKFPDLFPENDEKVPPVAKGKDDP